LVRLERSAPLDSFRTYFRSAVAGTPNMYAALGTTQIKQELPFISFFFKKQAKLIL